MRLTVQEMIYVTTWFENVMKMCLYGALGYERVGSRVQSWT